LYIWADVNPSLQIAKWFYFLSPLRGFVMVDGSCAQGHRFAHPCLLYVALSGLKITNVWIKYTVWAYYSHKQITDICTIHLIIYPPPYFWVGKYREENVKKFRLFERSEFLNFSFLNDKFSVKLRNTAAAFFCFVFFRCRKKMKREKRMFDLSLAFSQNCFIFLIEKRWKFALKT